MANKSFSQRRHKIPDEQPPEDLEPEVTMSEVKAAIKKLKNDKATGLDGIYGEMIKVGGDTVAQALKIIIDHVWKIGEWPSDWTQTEIITLPNEYQELKTAPNIVQLVCCPMPLRYY